MCLPNLKESLSKSLEKSLRKFSSKEKQRRKSKKISIFAVRKRFDSISSLDNYNDNEEQPIATVEDSKSTEFPVMVDLNQPENILRKIAKATFFEETLGVANTENFIGKAVGAIYNGLSVFAKHSEEIEVFDFQKN